MLRRDFEPRRDFGLRRGFDAVTVLTAYICVLLALPASMVVAPLGTAGAPATVIAIGTFVLWLWFLIQGDRQPTLERQPVRIAMLAWLVYMFAAYAHAMLQPISSDEISPADSGMLRLVAMCGIVLMANDGIPDLTRHKVLAQRLVVGVGLVALFGIFQTVTRQLWIDRLVIPGLTSGAADWALATRGGLARPSGTSTHPIEYGMVLTTVLPLAIVYARSWPGRRWFYRVLLVAISISTLLAISRSAMICAAVAVIVVAASWPFAAKLKTLLFIAAMATVVFITVPGVLGTITKLFTGANGDASVQSRTGSYEIAGTFIERSPIFGRGFGTFLPKYWILDNGYLGLLIEGGFLGLIGLLAVIVTGIVMAHKAVRRLDDPFEKDLARALVAGISAGGAGLALFDTFAFHQSAGVFFLMIGLAGAIWRLARSSQPRSPASSIFRRRRPTRVPTS